MIKTNRKGDTDRATSADDSIADPDVTLILTGELVCEAPCPSNQKLTEDCEETTRTPVHRKWEAAGCPAGDGFDFWLEAERKVNTKRSKSESFATSPTSSVEVLSCQVIH